MYENKYKVSIDKNISLCYKIIVEKIIFESVKVRRLSEIVENSIRDLILTRELKPGDRLPSEKEMSKQFGVSTVTLREALKGLEDSGFIEKKRGKGGGVFIPGIKRHTMRMALHHFSTSQSFSVSDLGELARIIEPAAFALAASRITPADLKELEKNIRYCEGKIKKAGQTISEEDFFNIAEGSTEFHSLIAEATHNPVLTLMIDYVMDFFVNFERNLLTSDIGLFTEVVKDHRKILRYLRKGDAQRGEEAIRAHIDRVEHYLAIKETQIS